MVLCALFFIRPQVLVLLMPNRMWRNLVCCLWPISWKQGKAWPSLAPRSREPFSAAIRRLSGQTRSVQRSSVDRTTVVVTDLTTRSVFLHWCSLCVNWWRWRRWKASHRWSSPPTYEMERPTWSRLEDWGVWNTTLWWSAGPVTGNSQSIANNSKTLLVNKKKILFTYYCLPTIKIS